MIGSTNSVSSGSIRIQNAAENTIAGNAIPGIWTAWWETDKANSGYLPQILPNYYNLELAGLICGSTHGHVGHSCLGNLNRTGRAIF
jgi:hypothetical protein